MNKLISMSKKIQKILTPYKKHLILVATILVVAVILIPNITATLDTVIKNKFKIPSGYSFFATDHYRNLFSDSLNKILFAGIAFIVVMILFNGFTKSLNKDKGKYEQFESYGSHGTASFKSDDEIEVSCEDKKGWFIGSMKEGLNYKIDMDGVYHPVDHKDLNMQMIVIGPPGSKKTTGFVLPNIFSICHQYKEEKERPDFIITDPKSEIFTLTSNYLKKNGYDIHVLDFINLKYGDSINPIDYIKDDKTLREISKDFVNSMSETDSSSGEITFWNNQEYQLLAALVGFVIQKNKKDKRFENTFEHVAEILKSDDVYGVAKSKKFFKEHSIKGAPLELWNSFLMFSGSEKTRSNVLGGLAEKMNLFVLDGIKKMTNKTTLKIEELGVIKKKPKAVFILMPDGRDTFSPIINMFITSIFNQLYETAYKNNNTLQVPVYAIMDEFCNIGRIPNINQRLGTFRSRKIYPMLIMQSLAQLRDLYKTWESILSQCDTKVFLGINDDFTANECSKSLGQTTIKSTNSSSNKNSNLLSVESIRESEGFQGRYLMLPDECRRIENQFMIVIQRSQKPMKIFKVQYEYWKDKICDEIKITDINKLPEKKIDKLKEDPVEKEKPDNDKKKVILEKKTDDEKETEIKEKGNESIFDNME
jgi:type IV secretion system protein VirD4